MSNDRFLGGARRFALGASMLVSCLAPAAADAATTVGSTQLRDNGAYTNEFTVCTEACTLSMRALPGHQVTSPTDGVVVRFQSGSTTGNLTFNIIRNNALVGAGVKGSSNGDVQSFPAQLPIRAGDRIGLSLEAGGTYGARWVDGAALDRWQPTLGTTARAPEYQGPESTEILFNATIEPDADRDGLGDESQDPTPPGRTDGGVTDPGTGEGTDESTDPGIEGRGECSARGALLHDGRAARITRVGFGRIARYVACHKETGETTVVAIGRVGFHAATSTGRFVGFATRVRGREHVSVFDTRSGARVFRSGRTRGSGRQSDWSVQKVVVTTTGHAAWAAVYSGDRAAPGTRNQVIAHSTRGEATIDDGRIPSSSLRLRPTGVDVQWTKAGEIVSAEIG